jgi:hypothetical protein
MCHNSSVLLSTLIYDTEHHDDQATYLTGGYYLFHWKFLVPGKIRVRQKHQTCRGCIDRISQMRVYIQVQFANLHP